MKQITLTIHVHPATAVRANRSHCGDIPLVLSDEDLASLSEEQRDTLVKHLAGERYYRDAWDEGSACAASLEELKKLLDLRRTSILANEKAEKSAREVNARHAAERDAETAAKKEAVRMQLATGPVENLVCSSRKTTWAAGYGNSIGNSIAEDVGRDAEVDAYLAAREAEKQAKKAAQKAETRALIAAQTPEHLAQFDAGLLPDTYVHECRKGALARMLGVEHRFAGNSGNIELKEIPPEHFQKYSDLKSKVEAVGATITLHSAYREALDDERGDADGEVVDDTLPVAYIQHDIAGAETAIEVALFE